MEMDTIINDWKQNAERHDDRNFKFLRSLKMKNERAVDRAPRSKGRGRPDFGSPALTNRQIRLKITGFFVGRAAPTPASQLIRRLLELALLDFKPNLRSEND